MKRNTKPKTSAAVMQSMEIANYVHGAIMKRVLKTLESGVPLSSSQFGSLAGLGVAGSPHLAAIIDEIQALPPGSVCGRVAHYVKEFLEGDDWADSLHHIYRSGEPFQSVVRRGLLALCREAAQKMPPEPRMVKNAKRRMRHTFGCSKELITLVEFLSFFRNVLPGSTSSLPRCMWTKYTRSPGSALCSIWNRAL